jgi:DNA-directed RNA polymerase specialized sigma subunit
MFLMHKIASVLGISKDELKSRLAGGQSIAEIAKSRGISEEKLIEKLKDSLTDELRHFVRMKHPARKPGAPAQ